VASASTSDVTVDDALGQAFGDGSLANAGIADEQRIVLRRRQSTCTVRSISFAADQRIDAAFAAFSFRLTQ
jgi:hypothetical protein